MIRRNNDSFYGPPRDSKQYPPERTGSRSVYIHNAGHPAFNPASLNSQETSTSERAVLYDPYDPGSSGSDTEGHEDRTGHHRSGRRGGYEGPAQHGGPAHHAASQFAHIAYGGRGANGVETPSVAASDKEAYPQQATPRLKLDYQHQTGFGGTAPPSRHRSPEEEPLRLDRSRQTREERERRMRDRLCIYCGGPGHAIRECPTRPKRPGTLGMDQVKSTPEVSRKRSRSPCKDIRVKRLASTAVGRGHFSCDLCEVELSEAKALEEHLESSGHWQTLEHIQLQNKYDDMAVAFIQESMLHKVRKGDQVINDDTINELHEKDHMTKVEVLHCGPCNIYIPMSVSSVQNHLISQEHLRNKTDFRMKQRDACLTTAETLMKRLTPQYALFLEGKDPFE